MAYNICLREDVADLFAGMANGYQDLVYAHWQSNEHFAAIRANPKMAAFHKKNYIITKARFLEAMMEHVKLNPIPPELFFTHEFLTSLPGRPPRYKIPYRANPTVSEEQLGSKDIPKSKKLKHVSEWKPGDEWSEYDHTTDPNNPNYDPRK